MSNVVPMVKSLGKKFATSYSRLKNFEACPKRYHEIDILKNYVEPDSDALLWGGSVHKALEDRLVKKTPLPVTMARYEGECLGIEDAVRQGARMHVEMKLAFDQHFRAAGYFDKGVWFRGKCDVLLLQGTRAWALDWKTGNVKEDIPQLALMAQCIFSNYPEVDEVGTTFVWLGSGEDGDALYQTEMFDQDKMVGVWNNLWPRFHILQQAHERNEFPPRESGLCRRHCVVTSCKFNGRR